MDYTTLLPEQREAHVQTSQQTYSLYAVCRQLADGRAARGKRYDLAALIVLLTLAKLAGESSLLGASEWIRLRGRRLCLMMHLSWKHLPCANTYRYALERLSSQEVNATLAAWMVRTEAESRCGEEPSRLATQADARHVHLAVDGKALRGTGAQAYGGEDAQKQVLHVYEVQTGIVLQQCPIAQDHNEVSTLKPLLTEVLCKGRIFTADAAQSYHEFGRLVQRAGGDVVMIIKGNTPATQADLELFFEDEQADRRTWQSYVQVEKGHGRLERRQMVTSPDLNDSPRSRLGRGGTGVSFATGTEPQAGAKYGSGLRLDQSFASALFPEAAAAPDSRTLGYRKSAPLAARCDAGRGPVRRPSSTGGGNVGGPQHGGPLLDGSVSRF